MLAINNISMMTSHVTLNYLNDDIDSYVYEESYGKVYIV